MASVISMLASNLPSTNRLAVNIGGIRLVVPAAPTNVCPLQVVTRALRREPREAPVERQGGTTMFEATITAAVNLHISYPELLVVIAAVLAWRRRSDLFRSVELMRRPLWLYRQKENAGTLAGPSEPRSSSPSPGVGRDLDQPLLAQRGNRTTLDAGPPLSQG